MARYRTLAELRDAYRNGCEGLAPVVIGWDGVSAVEGGSCVSVEVFDSTLRKMLDDALDLLGIPFEHV